MIYRLPAGFMAIYMFPKFAIFYCQIFYLKVFDNFYAFTLNWLFTTVPFSLPHLEVRNTVGRLENAERP